MNGGYYLIVLFFAFPCRSDQTKEATPNITKFEKYRRPSTDPLVQDLLEAALHGDLATVREIIMSEGLNTEVQSDDGWTALNLASLAGHLSIVHFLVAVGANLETRERSGQTPVGSAALNGHESIVRYLLSLDPPAKIDAIDEQGALPIHYASQYGFTDVCRTLLQAGAAVDVQASSNGWTPLHAAAAAGYVDTVKLLLDWNADRNLFDYEGRLPSNVIGTTRQITRRARVLVQCLLDPGALVASNGLCPREDADLEPGIE